MKKGSTRNTIDICDYRVEPDTRVRLRKWPTRIAPLYDSDMDYDQQLATNKEQLSNQQQLLYAHDRYALLLIFQAMDAAGKDGAIRHVMSGVNPQGCQVFSFKHPSAQELDHDFLWRTHLALPERGRIGIFNRSYYEEVLIVKVQPDILKAQGLPDSVLADKHFWEGRYRSIVDSESHLHRNGTRILKFFLHLSREEQRRRFIARIDDPDKQWKFNLSDIAQRDAWDEYMKAYEACIGATSHPLRKLRTIYSGLRYAVIHDLSVAWKLVVSVLILAAAVLVRDWVDSVLIIVVTVLVLYAEITNSAIEALCDFVETRHNEKIGIIKDIAAAGVGVAMFAWLLVLGFELEEILRAAFFLQ